VKTVSDKVQGRSRIPSKPATTAVAFGETKGKLFGFTQAKSPVFTTPKTKEP
jgi:hypothetical protein